MIIEERSCFEVKKMVDAVAEVLPAEAEHEPGQDHDQEGRSVDLVIKVKSYQVLDYNYFLLIVCTSIMLNYIKYVYFIHDQIKKIRLTIDLSFTTAHQLTSIKKNHRGLVKTSLTSSPSNSPEIYRTGVQ